MAESNYSHSGLMTGNAQTMLTWTQVLHEWSEIPPAYLDALRPLLSAEDPFPYLILAPRLKNRRIKSVERLLMLRNNTLDVLEKHRQGITYQRWELSPQLDLESGNALLFSWITLRELRADHSTRSLSLTFNTATARHYQPLLEWIRPVPSAESMATIAEREDLHRALVSADFKFNYFARESLLNEEQVSCSLWQPTIREKRFEFLGRTWYKTHILAHFTILTQQALILLWDDERSIESRGVRYGGIRRFIPLDHIAKVSLHCPEGAWCCLQVTLQDEECIQRCYEMDQKEAVLDFIQRFP